MELEWKKSLYVYVDQLNKARVAPGADPRRTAVMDPRYLVAQGSALGGLPSGITAGDYSSACGDRCQDTAHRPPESG